MKRILITGVAGFLGSSLKDFISDNLNEYEVYGIDISLERSIGNYFKGDINDSRFLKNTIKEIKPHYIFHLAGLTDKNDFYKLISVNVLTTAHLLNTILGLKNLKTRIVIPGSAAEYGDTPEKDMPVKENYALRPIDFYGLSKAYQTILGLTYSMKGLEIIVGRIFNISGWATPSKLAIGSFAYSLSLIEKGLKKSTIETKDLSSKRDYIDIKDVCSALIAIAEKGKKGNIYNICSGVSYKTGDMLNRLIGLSNVGKIKIKTLDNSALEIKNIKGSNEKIKKETEWNHEITISESLRNTLIYYRKYDNLL